MSYITDDEIIFHPCLTWNDLITEKIIKRVTDSKRTTNMVKEMLVKWQWVVKSQGDKDSIQFAIFTQN